MKKSTIIMIIISLIFVLSYAGEISGNRANPLTDARMDAQSNIEPIIFGLSSCLSSYVLSGIVSVGIMMLLQNVKLYTSWPVYIVPAVSCLIATGLAYFINPEVPYMDKDMDELYIEQYRSAYRHILKTKRTIYTFIGGVLGYFLTVLSVFILFLTVFSA